MFHAMVALEEKRLPYKLEILPQPLSASTRDRLTQHALTAELPVLAHGDVWIGDSLAITEYLAEVFSDPDSPTLLPHTAAERARARQLMQFLRTGLGALYEDRPTTSVFGRAAPRPMSAAARAQAAELERIARALLPDDRPYLFGAWSIADCDLAVALLRLIAGDDPPGEDLLDRRLLHYATAQLDRRAVQRFVAHLPTTR